MSAKLSDHLGFRQFKVLQENMILVFLTQLHVRVQEVVQCQCKLAKSLSLSLVKSGMVGFGTP